MSFLTNLLTHTTLQVWTTFTHNWPFLLASVVIAALLKLYVDPARISAFLMRYRSAGVIGATAAAVGTPLCSCGTTAIILGMMANSMPWAPIVAFMVASPLTSPEELIYSAGLFGWPFALAFFIASILLGLFGGLAAGLLENRGWLANQTRMSSIMDPVGETTRQTISRAAPSTSSLLSYSLSKLAAFAVPVAAPVAMAVTAPACGCAQSQAPRKVERKCSCDVPEPAESSCACDDGIIIEKQHPLSHTLHRFLVEAFLIGKSLLLMFLGFAFIGYFLNGLIPAAWVAAVFGQGNAYSIPLAATLGLPLYINTEASLPLVRALIDGGMSQGAALAFLITGAGTSIGAVAGMLTIARWRVIGLVVGCLWAGAVIAGYLYNFLLACKLF